MPTSYGRNMHVQGMCASLVRMVQMSTAGSGTRRLADYPHWPTILACKRSIDAASGEQYQGHVTILLLVQATQGFEF